MAKPPRIKVKITNTADGPRSFFDAEGGNHILRHGESWGGEILEAEKRDLSADLELGDKAAREAEGGDDEGARAERIRQDAEELARGRDLPALLEIAKVEKVKLPEGEPNLQAVAIAIATKRADKPAS